MIGSGGSPAAGQYVLDEDGDIEGASIVVNAVAATSGGAAPDVHIFDVDIDGSQTSGGGASSVEVNTTGSILVGGAINYANAGADDSLSLNSGDKIEVATDAGGSIAMTDSSGNLSGSLTLTGHDVWVANQATLAKLEANPDYAARNTDLGTNTGANNQAGFLQAGGITVDLLGSSLMVQNSGTAQQPAGISIGSGGLTIINEGTEPATVILYGRRVSGGTTISGSSFVPLVVTTGTLQRRTRQSTAATSAAARRPTTSDRGGIDPRTDRPDGQHRRRRRAGRGRELPRPGLRLRPERKRRRGRGRGRRKRRCDPAARLLAGPDQHRPGVLRSADRRSGDKRQRRRRRPELMWESEMRRTLLAAIAALTSLAAPAAAPAAPLSVLDSFRIGNGGTVYCSAQNVATDKGLGGMFDTGYSVTCRDAALPVGKIYKLRNPAAAQRGSRASANANAECAAPRRANVADVGAVDVIDCKLKGADVGYRAYQVAKGDMLYAAEGLTGYDSALQLGLRSVVSDRPVKGEVSIATTGAGDPAAFARVQAGTLDPAPALAEAYRRNNAGSYAEAAEFFAAVSKSAKAR